MKFDILVTLKKGILGFFTGLAAAVVLAIVQAISNYNPVICTDTIVDGCTPKFIAQAWLMVIPTVSAFLVGIANWLKNRGKS